MSDAPSPTGTTGPPREPLLDRAIYRFGWYLCRALFRLFYRTRYEGGRALPDVGGCLLVCNHQSHLDPPLVGTCVENRSIHFIARVGLYKNPLFGWLITHMHTIPIREDAGDMAAIKEAIARIGKGQAVCIFAEGTRSPDGTLQPFKRGVALLLKKAKCPVVPVAIEGAHDVMPKGRSLPKLTGRLGCKVGEPIPHDELLADGTDGALLRMAREVETLRLDLRAQLRERTKGKYPSEGVADGRALWLEEAPSPPEVEEGG